jgi:hypothetical protein
MLARSFTILRSGIKSSDKIAAQPSSTGPTGWLSAGDRNAPQDHLLDIIRRSSTAMEQ